MPREFTSGFEVLGFTTDPTPGDPDQIQAFAERHADVRDDARRAVEVLGSDGSIKEGRGEAMDALRKVLNKLPEKLQTTADSFDQATRAYETYAANLRDRQFEMDGAMRDAVAVASLAATPLPEIGDDATDAQRRTAEENEDAILGAQTSLSRTRSLAEQIKQARDVAAETAADELDLAAAKAIPDRSFLEKVGDFFSEFPFIRLIVDVVLAFVTIAFPILGFALAVGAFILFSAAAAANNSLKKGTFVVDLLALIPGGRSLSILGNNATKILPTIGTRGTGDIVSSIRQSREAISLIPLQNSALVFVRETAATGARTFTEKKLNGEPIDGGSIVLTSFAVGLGLGALQLRSDRNRKEIRDQNEGLPDSERKELPFDAEHDLDSIQEDARERVLRSTAVFVEKEIDKAQANTAQEQQDKIRQSLDKLPPIVASPLGVVRTAEGVDPLVAEAVLNDQSVGPVPDQAEVGLGLAAGFVGTKVFDLAAKIFFRKKGFNPAFGKPAPAPPPTPPSTPAPSRPNTPDPAPPSPARTDSPTVPDSPTPPASPISSTPPRIDTPRPASPIDTSFIERA